MTEKFWRGWRSQHKWRQLMHDMVVETAQRKLPAVATIASTGPRLKTIHDRYKRKEITAGDLAIEQTFIFHAAFFAEYARNKQYYYIDNSLNSALASCQFPANTPCSALLSLPRKAFVMVLGDMEIAIHFDVNHENVPMLYAGVVRPIRTIIPQYAILPFMAVKIDDTKIQDYYEDVFTSPHGQSIVDELDVKQLSFEEQIDKVRGLLNILLYMAGEPEIVERIGHRKPVTEQKKPRKVPTKDEVPEDIIASDVGIQFGRTFKRYVDEVKERSVSTGTGRAMRPHIRAAHAHLYWVNDIEAGLQEDGKFKKRAIVRFLLPIAVKGGKEVEDRQLIRAQVAK